MRKVIKHKQVVKEFDKRPHRMSCRSLLRTALSFCAAYTAVETPNAFQWAGQPPKLTLPVGGSRLPPNAWFLGPTRVSHPNGISIGSAVFCRADPCDKRTHAHTDHATCDLCSNRPHSMHCMHAMRPNICDEA